MLHLTLQEPRNTKTPKQPKTTFFPVVLELPLFVDWWFPVTVFVNRGFYFPYFCSDVSYRKKQPRITPTQCGHRFVFRPDTFQPKSISFLAFGLQISGHSLYSRMLSCIHRNSVKNFEKSTAVLRRAIFATVLFFLHF
jgi:hypothetical protein